MSRRVKTPIGGNLLVGSLPEHVRDFGPNPGKPVS